MRKSLNRIAAAVTTAATVLAMLAPTAPVRAAEFTSKSDTMTRLKISTTADHTVRFTLPSGVDFDHTGGRDSVSVDFPSGFTSSASGTWVTGDFTFNDGTARTVNAVAQGSGVTDVGCADGANNVGIAVDTAAAVFKVLPCGTSYTASTSTSTVTLTIDGTTTDGTLTNPSSAGSNTISLSMVDNGSTANQTGSLAVSIADDDQVTVTATVDPSITFDLDTATTDTESAAPYTVALGTITSTDTRVSGTTDGVNFIWIDLSTNASLGAQVTIRNANGSSGLVSTSVTADDIDSTDGSVGDNTENYGVCIVTSTATTGTFDDEGPYDGDTCAANSETNNVQQLTTTGEVILDTNNAAVDAGRAQISVQASITSVQPAHNDYTDTLTFIATGTF
jgi:hypothetical protein